MLSLAILGLLMDESLHGYEIRLRLQRLLGLSGLISFGSLYPKLAKLNLQGFVSVEIVTPEVSPNTKTKLSERKKRQVYTITQLGREAFSEKLSASYLKNASDDRAFVAHLAFIEYASPEDSKNLISHRKRVLQDRLEIAPTTKNRFLKKWQELEANFINSQINFLDTLNIKPEENRTV